MKITEKVSIFEMKLSKSENYRIGERRQDRRETLNQYLKMNFLRKRSNEFYWRRKLSRNKTRLLNKID